MTFVMWKVGSWKWKVKVGNRKSTVKTEKREMSEVGCKI